MVGKSEISEKAQWVLKALVERYIADGQPVGSKTLAAHTRVAVSSATVRNIMGVCRRRWDIVFLSTVCWKWRL
jgi:transcriptional regulator of heat shock response